MVEGEADGEVVAEDGRLKDAHYLPAEVVVDKHLTVLQQQEADVFEIEMMGL